MRTITVSTDVFARIWSLRGKGEETEDAILRRVLCDVGRERDSKNPTMSPGGGDGVFDARHGVRFPEGFEIERTYLGKRYSAIVRNGRWAIHGIGGEFARLNELSRAVGTKTENAWVNWFYFDHEGRRRPVSDLRIADSIGTKTSATEKRKGESAVSDESLRWCDDVKAALRELGGRASLDAIYREVEKIRRIGGRSMPRSFEAIVRRTLEDFSADSENFRGENWFAMAEGKGGGVWALR